MSLLLLSALSIAAPVMTQCSWDRPGANAFMGDVVAAVDRYQDIPAPVRTALQRRMKARQYDEIAVISRDAIQGAYRYADLRDMHFGQGTVCRTVTRDRWAAQAQERALVYCEEGHCLLVPTVCRNVSRVTRVPMSQADAADAAGPPEPAAQAGGAARPAMAEAQDTGELSFDPPAAGRAEPNSFASGALGSGSGEPAASDGGLDFGSGGSAGGSGPWAGLASPGLGRPFPFWGAGTLPGLAPSAAATAGGPVPGIPGPGSVTVIPEPRAIWLALAGLAVLIWARRRRALAPAARMPTPEPPCR
ncbi:MAG: MHFG family PEP-CTERM protein [Rubrivivax sp.]|nr:MHFG family PEP-CTERM protein [Rubrivivax sp.]